MFASFAPSDVPPKLEYDSWAEAVSGRA